MAIELDTPSSHLAVFIVLLVLMVPSVSCSLFIFYHFIQSHELRQRINNHAILLLLVITFLQARKRLSMKSCAHLLRSSRLLVNFLLHWSSFWKDQLHFYQKAFVVFGSFSTSFWSAVHYGQWPLQVFNVIGWCSTVTSSIVIDCSFIIFQWSVVSSIPSFSMWVSSPYILVQISSIFPAGSVVVHVISMK